MDVLSGKLLIRTTGQEILADDVVKDKMIGFYFSAHWCPPCRKFTPILKDFYDDLIEQGAPFEIVYVSSDKSPKEMREYMMTSHGAWLAIGFGDPIAAKLKKLHEVRGIPALVVVKNSGDVITKDGRQQIQDRGLACFPGWKSAAGFK